ncbi:hypothetical protein C8Q69DRAFT_442046 [Paecilomyces variotii]|uniref:Uncharacterized protein n=1 Tax=Byssochlamys spectabilis TaxID=264951 RepID=A0A443I1C4_BYSSP|nr:hypothetical protein C8Q69DRAFT_442046 [Paecilomyces variotii]RWQ97868.1 hypothetical protein C8Q69DRAFT_442046 [Paecilomyces variotii]
MSHSLSPEEIPEGWTTDPDYIDFLDGEWGRIAKRCGLENPIPIMHTTPESGEIQGGQMTFDIYEIIRPTTLDGILKKIRDKKERLIKTRELEQVPTQEDLERAKENEKAGRALMEKMQSPGFLDWAMSQDWSK